jgi:hypothetical protein
MVCWLFREYLGSFQNRPGAAPASAAELAQWPGDTATGELFDFAVGDAVLGYLPALGMFPGTTVIILASEVAAMLKVRRCGLIGPLSR